MPTQCKMRDHHIEIRMWGDYRNEEIRKEVRNEWGCEHPKNCLAFAPYFPNQSGCDMEIEKFRTLLDGSVIMKITCSAMMDHVQCTE